MADTVIRYASTPGQTITARFEATPITSNPVPTVQYFSDALLTTSVSGPTNMTFVSAAVWTAPVPNLAAQTLYIDYAYKTVVGGTLLHNSDDVLLLVAADVLSSDGLYTLPEFDAYLQATADPTTATLLRDLVTGMLGDRIGSAFDPDTAPVTVKAIALEAAARAYRNPEGISSISEAIDDYSTTRRWEGAAGMLGLFLTAGEISTILNLYGTSAAFTITPFYEPPTSALESWA